MFVHPCPISRFLVQDPVSNLALFCIVKVHVIGHNSDGRTENSKIKNVINVGSNFQKKSLTNSPFVTTPASLSCALHRDNRAAVSSHSNRQFPHTRLTGSEPGQMSALLHRAEQSLLLVIQPYGH